MEPYYGRRGKESGGVCGINRANQTMLLMLAMVATMGVVLLWEASPFTGTVAVHSPDLKSVPRSELGEQAKIYESRPFLKQTPVEETDEDSVDVTESDATPDLVEETEVAQREPETILEAVKLTEGETLEAKPSDKVSEKKKKRTTRALENVSTFESHQRLNETLAESEETSLVEKEIPSTEKASLSTLIERTPDDHEKHKETQTEDEMIIEVDLEERRTLKPMGTPLVADVREGTGAKGMKLSSAMEDEFEAETISHETRDSSEKKCDYSVGKWVLDDTRPLYSGFECEMWMSPGFSCRRNNHPDKLLDRYRWQPAGCNLPLFNASAVLETLRNKVIAFVGDSLGRQQLQSLMCMLTRGRNETAITDVGSDFGFYIPKGERKPTGFAYRFDETNTTIMYKWTVTLARVEPLNVTDPLTRNALHLDRPEEFLETHLEYMDAVILNSGHHWNGGKMKLNRYDFYIDGRPVNKSMDLIHVPVAYNMTVHKVLQWMHNKTVNTEKVVFYRSLSPRHFRNGDWNTGGTCDNIRFDNDKQVQEGWRLDPNAESAILGTSVHLLNVTSLSLDRGETHVSKYGGDKKGQDCLHWCLPGIPDTWNEVLFAELATKFKRRSSSMIPE